MDLSTIDSPEAFYRLIPKDVQGNIRFRMDLHTLLAKDFQAQAVYFEMCRQYLPIMFATLFWTLDPRKPEGKTNQPFIPRWKQEKVILTLDECIKEGKDVGIENDLSKPSIKTKLFLDTTKAKEILGWTPEVSLDEGIRKTIAWYRENILS